MNYHTGFCFTSRDLFENWNYKKLCISPKIYKGTYHCECIVELFAKVFLYYMFFVLLDIIENNTTFVLPLKGNRHAMIHVKVFDGDKFQKLYSRGKFMGIDFLSSLFKGYQLFFAYNYRGGERDKPIYINDKMKQLFYSYINSGKVYY
ncbi:MAG: hypothetical protein IJ193_08865 [Bacilli bacterium]|nr:hypothetical protein [Bacilli bacterium]